MSIIPTQTRRPRTGSAQPVDEDWFIAQRWGSDIRCPVCDGPARYVENRTPAPLRCLDRDCGRQFGAKTGTFAANSTLSYERWRKAFDCLRGRLWTTSAEQLSEELRVTRMCASSVLLRIQRAVRSGEWLSVAAEQLDDAL